MSLFMYKIVGFLFRYLPTFWAKVPFFYQVIFYQAPQFTVGQTEYEDRHASRHGNFFLRNIRACQFVIPTSL